MKKIVVANNKGGVGKTTIASQLAYALSERGHSVMGIDLDGQRNFTSCFSNVADLGNSLDLVLDGKAVKASLSAGEIGIVAGHADLKAQNSDDVMINVKSALTKSAGADYCILDTPPSFGEAVYGALLGADYLLVPIELKRFSIDGIEEAIEAFKVTQKHNQALKFLGILPSRYDAVKQAERDALTGMLTKFPELIIPHAIRNRTAYVEAQEDGSPLSNVKTKSGKEAKAEFTAFFDWFYKKVEGGA